MDIQLKKKPWYRRHKYYLAGGVLFLVFVGYVVRLALAPQQYRVSRQDVRVARVDGQLVINPCKSELAKADLDIMVGATYENIMMVEL